MRASQIVRCLTVLSWTIPRLQGFLPLSTVYRHAVAKMSVAPQEKETELLAENQALQTSSSKRVRILNKLGFKRLAQDQAEIRKAKSKAATPKKKVRVTKAEDLDPYFRDEEHSFRDEKGDIDYASLLTSLVAEGNTQQIGSRDKSSFVHPVVKMLHERRRNESMPCETARADGFRVALSIEGGGMRGVVSAGAVAAINHLNLTDSIDVIYGSSAGSIVGSYLITRQLPYFGPEVYYDALTTAGRQFIDTRRLLRSLGFGLLDPRLLKDVLTRPSEGKPVLNLSFLLKRTLQEKKPLDWEKFKAMQNVQPLKVMASSLKGEKAVIMEMANGSFETLEELSNCMHASCLLPGLAGPLMNLNRTAVAMNTTGKKLIVGNNLQGDDIEPLADSLLFEPIPYRTALQEGATHVVAIRSRPDGTDVSGKASIFENLIFKRFFLRKNSFPNMFKYMTTHTHKKVYAKDVLTLNEYANSTRDHKDLSEPHILTVALPPGSSEVTKLETARDEIFAGLRRGFARAYDALVEDPSERGRGHEVARHQFPDEILDYDPLDIDSKSESAFEYYMRENDVIPSAWGSPESH